MVTTFDQRPSFAQVIGKARDFEASLKWNHLLPDNSLKNHYTSSHQVQQLKQLGKQHTRSHLMLSNPEPLGAPNHVSQTYGSFACFQCSCTPHAARRDCPADNDICHCCGKRGNWQYVCQASTANAVSVTIHNEPKFCLHPEVSL